MLRLLQIGIPDEKKKKNLDMTVVCKVLLYIYYSGEARKCPFDFETVLVLNEQQ